MNPEDEARDAAQTAAHNPFPEPQTIPDGWDTSVFFAPPAAAQTRAEAPVESESE